MIRYALVVAGVVGCALAAHATGAKAPSGYRLDHYHAPTPDAVPGGTVIHTATLARMLRDRTVVLVDVLPAPRRPKGLRTGALWMPKSHRDIPHSVWMPDVGRGVLNPSINAWFRHQLSILAKNRNAAIVFYCHMHCWMSWNAAKRAASIGYRHVFWYPGGTERWNAAGMPLSVAHPLRPPD